MLTLSTSQIQTLLAPYLIRTPQDRTPRRRCLEIYNPDTGKFGYAHIQNIIDSFVCANSDRIYAEAHIQSVLDYLNKERFFVRPVIKELPRLLELNLRRMIKEKTNYLENLKRFFLPLTQWGYEDIFEDEYEKEQDWHYSDFGV